MASPILTQFKQLHIACSFMALLLCEPCQATTITTRWGNLAYSVASAIEFYATAHDGSLPSDIDSLFSGSTKVLLEEKLGGPVSSKIFYYVDKLPLLNEGKTQLLGVVAFPIEEDRRESVGRYVIYRQSDGKIGSRWVAENILQSAAGKAGIVIPYAPLYREKPLKALDPDYSARLVEDAVLKHAVPLEQAVKAVEKHVDDVINRRAKAAATWAEVVAASAEATHIPSDIPAASLQPITPVTRIPAAAVEQRAPVWPWMVGILALVVIVALALKWRA